ncbi:endolytic transglycosylase MltG [Carbonactinospora thermoautotrophica]|uniref:Endolytic murein transglycosylase n=1 Tax=Carbonactinospora thermoautotrophica TaxID=1469144 RepID=A0A132MS08_9ACTN|nr:endolytic transglycosylase MltG [Carbonactinospora thermoautotrophica]KWX00675.1 putative integral membrane protein [Carbonactinospora thermoautotrophica]MCX9193040.1 endolytic transglycosylase MltG [Carbonactinospora thermoautotrophica]
MSQLGLSLAQETSGPRMSRREARRRRRKRRQRAAIATALTVLVLFGLVGGGGYYGYTFWQNRYGPGADYESEGSGEVVVQVEKGDTATAIGRELYERGVIKSVRAFVTVANDNPERAGSIQPGMYKLRLRMSAKAAFEMLLDPASRVGSLIVPEGKWAKEIYALIAKNSDITEDRLKVAAAKPEALGVPAYGKGKGVEGFLFPSRYDFPRGTTAEQALKQMVDRYNQTAQKLDLEHRAEKLGYSPYEILIIASLVQAEAYSREDMGKVARVVYNRLNSAEGWQRRLQFDSTINYAKGTHRLDWTVGELQEFDSPYNSYLRQGLPPTPICNPGADALEAALNPTPGPWTYFITIDPAGSKETRFTDDYDEFLKWKQEYKQNQSGGG